MNLSPRITTARALLGTSTLKGLGSLALVAVLTVPVLGSAASASPITDKQAQAAQLVAQIAAQQQSMSALDEAYNQAQLKAKAVDAAVTQAQMALDKAQGEYNAVSAQLEKQAVLDFIQGGNVSTLQDLVQGSASQLALRQNYLDTATGNEKDTIDRLHTLRLVLTAKQADLASAQAAAHKALDAVGQSRQAAAALATQEQATLDSVKGQLAVLVRQEQAKVAAAQAAKIQAELAAQTYRYGGSANAYSGQPPPPASAGMVKTVLYWAHQALGRPYVYGAAGPDSFDCSGLVMWAFGHAGVSLPHSAQAQYDDTTRVPISDLQPGDLVFYFQPVDHVGIYIGGGTMIVAPHTGTVVQEQNIYYDGLIGGGRVG